MKAILVIVQSILLIEAKQYVLQVSSVSQIHCDDDVQTLIIESKNRYSQLSPTSFINVPNLNELYIFSAIENLTPDVFAPLSQLNYLRLEDNILHTLDASLWCNLKLDKLSLRNNLIESIHPETFKGLKVAILDLSHNKLRSIPLTCLRDSLVYKLILANNRLTSIEVGTFWPQIAYIDLSNNWFTKLDAQVFQNLNGLTRLCLSGNKLTSFGAIPNLSRLKVLDLSNNHISQIEDKAFTHYGQLQELYLNGNKIVELSAALFPNTASLQKLVIHRNYLTYLERDLLTQLSALEFIKFGANPWSCECLHNIEEFIRRKDVQMDACESQMLAKHANFYCFLRDYDRCYYNETQLFWQHYNCFDDFIANYEC